MNTAIFEKMTEQLTQVLNDPAQLAEYEKPQFLAVSFGWDGRALSPVSRCAYVSTYGADTVEAAESAARERLADNATTYATSRHAAAMKEAQAAESDHNAPAAGAFVLAVNSGLKADSGDGLSNELREAARDPEWMAKKEAAPRLVKVCEVYEVSADDFTRPGLADELVQRATAEGREFPGGAEIATEDENRRDVLDDYRYYYTLCAAVVCGGRWFLIDSEGYNYARYIYMPTNWREMFAQEFGEEQRKEQERRDAQAKREAEEKAERLAAYVTRCAKYHGLLQDVRPLFDAQNKAQTAHGWSSKEYKTAARDVLTAQKRNLLTMGRAAFPGLKITAKKSDRYRGAFDVTYYDGPRVETFDAATDYDLFISCTIGRDYLGECDEFHRKEFTDFAAQYMGVTYGDIKTAREWSKETAARLLAQVLEAVPAAAGSCYETPYQWTGEDLRKVADKTGANASYLVTQWEDGARCWNYINAERVARWCFDSMDLYTAPTEPKKPRKGEKAAEGATAKDESRETVTTDESNAQGLTMEKYSEKATIIRGYNADQLAELLAMGGKEWHRLKGGKGVIFSTRRHADKLAAWMDQQQGEGTTAPAADQPADIAPAATLQEAGEISVKLCERIYNDTAAPVAIGGTVIYNKFKRETPRRAVVTGYDDTIKMYFLETEDGQNIATGRDGFAVCGPESSAEEPAESAPDFAAQLKSAKGCAVAFRIGARVIVCVKNGRFWNMSNGDGTGTQYDVTTQEAADVLALDYQDAQREGAQVESVTRTAEGYDVTADGLELRAVVVGCEDGEIINGFLTLEDAHAAGWYGRQLEADPADVCQGSDGFRGARLLVECCREEDAGTLRIAYGTTYEQAAANYRAGRFGLAEVMNNTAAAA